jgi:hypothetical protein
MLIPHTHDLNPFGPILEEIAKHGDNLAPIPVANAYERDDDGQYRWTVDVDVRIRNRISFDLSFIGETLHEAVAKALTQVRRELGRCS